MLITVSSNAEYKVNTCHTEKVLVCPVMVSGRGGATAESYVFRFTLALQGCSRGRCIVAHDVIAFGEPCPTKIQSKNNSAVPESNRNRSGPIYVLHNYCGQRPQQQQFGCSRRWIPISRSSLRRLISLLADSRRTLQGVSPRECSHVAYYREDVDFGHRRWHR